MKWVWSDPASLILMAGLIYLGQTSTDTRRYVPGLDSQWAESP